MNHPRCILIGTGHTVEQMNEQLRLLRDPPECVGCVLTEEEHVSLPVLGRISELEAIVDRYRPGMALVSLPAAMTGLVTKVRTTLRRLGVADRFLATLEDQIAGVGPRSQFVVEPTELIDRHPHELDESLIATHITGKRVMITGAGGSIGSELVRQCARYQPSELLLMERAENALFEIDRQAARFWPDIPRRALLHDVTQAERTRAICEQTRPNVIFHAAAHKHVPMMEGHPAHAVDNNVFGTKAIVDAAAAADTERLVMISTDKAVNPSSVMGATKRLAEYYVQHTARRLKPRTDGSRLMRIVRFGNVLGSACSVLPIWSGQLAEGGPLTVTHPEMTRYFMTIPEAASLVIQAGVMEPTDKAPTGGEVFILDMGEPIRILDLARRFVRAHGLQPVESPDQPLGQGGLRIVTTGARPGEKLHEELAHANEETAPTPHPAIRVWRGDAPRADHIMNMVHDLERVRYCDQPQQTLEAIRLYIPTLGSQQADQRASATTAA